MIWIKPSYFAKSTTNAHKKAFLRCQNTDYDYKTSLYKNNGFEIAQRKQTITRESKNVVSHAETVVEQIQRDKSKLNDKYMSEKWDLTIKYFNIVTIEEMNSFENSKGKNLHYYKKKRSI